MIGVRPPCPACGVQVFSAPHAIYSVRCDRRLRMHWRCPTSVVPHSPPKRPAAESLSLIQALTEPSRCDARRAGRFGCAARGVSSLRGYPFARFRAIVFPPISRLSSDAWSIRRGPHRRPIHRSTGTSPSPASPSARFLCFVLHRSPDFGLYGHYPFLGSIVARFNPVRGIPASGSLHYGLAAFLRLTGLREIPVSRFQDFLVTCFRVTKVKGLPELGIYRSLVLCFSGFRAKPVSGFPASPLPLFNGFILSDLPCFLLTRFPRCGFPRNWLSMKHRL